MDSELYERFCRTKQDKEKLRAAVGLVWQAGEEIPPDVERYLRLRQRPAVEFLIRQGDLNGLRRILAYSWAERNYLPDYLRMAREAGRTELVAELLQAWYRGQKTDSHTIDEKVKVENRVRGAGDCAENTVWEAGERVKENVWETGRGRRKWFAEEEDVTAREIMHLTIQNLLQRFPILGGALLSLEPVQMEAELETETVPAPFGTDGEHLYYGSRYICQLFRQEPESVEMLTLHSLFHCLLYHIFLPCTEAERETADREADGLAEEQQARVMAEEMGMNTVWDRESCGCPPVRMSGDRTVHDCHDFWPARRKKCAGTDSGQTELLHWRWRRLAAGGGSVGAGLFHGGWEGSLRQKYEHRRRKTYDYRRFLERFMIRMEEIGLDLENFDPVWYHYSRSRYEGLVFWEPLETREVKRLEELLIAIDTSASCSGQVVERFLDKTFAILERQDHFFRRMNVHIVQCDCMIQEHVRITCEREWRDYREHLAIRGLGDTDFTPVFTLAGELIRSGQIKNLKGILYFTDGDGIFPRQAPPWPSAFVFLNRELEKRELPDWALRLNLSEG